MKKQPKQAPAPTIEVVVQSGGTVVEINRAKRRVTIELHEQAKIAAYEVGDMVELEHDKVLLLEAFCR